MLESLDWAARFASDFQYVLKTDDDSFVRVDRIIFGLVHTPPEDADKLCWGNLRIHTKVRSQGKFREPNPAGYRFYPTYAAGGGYVLSMQLVKSIVGNTNMTGHHRFRAEDASVGLWLETLNVTWRNDNRFKTLSIDRRDYTIPCAENAVILHKQSSIAIKQMNSSLEQSGFRKQCVLVNGTANTGSGKKRGGGRETNS